MTGKLYIVATPLGNLDDLSPRALDTLRSVACIACEDTRRTARLLARYEISVPTVSCHRFNERQRLEPILSRIRSGDKIALVSDGGTPGVSDPGSLLVQAALDEGLEVTPIPGPSAVAALLGASGLPGDRYVFEGFLPHRGGERRRRLRELRGETRTVVAFETPHRILAALDDIEAIFGDRMLVLGRELTKLHETIVRGTASQIALRLGDSVRGEITLAWAGARANRAQEPDERGTAQALDAWREELERAGGDRRTALRRTAKRLGMKRAELQRLLDELDETSET